MKVFIFKSAFFACVVVSIILLISSSYKPFIDLSNDYMASIIDKHARLKQSVDNRILLVGGSNLTFGVNSEELEKHLHKKVINLGLHGGLGLEFILNEAISEVKKGDIVILSIEYSLFNVKNQPDFDLIKHTQVLFPESKSYYKFNLNVLREIYFDNFKKYFEKEKIRMDSGTIYNRKSFNVWGDIITPDHRKNQGRLYGEKFDKIVISGINKKFRKINSKCKLAGAKLYLVFPNYPKSEFDINRNVINDIASQIREELYFIPIINNPETFVLDDSLFYDTVYHLNGRGREKRTKMLIDIIKYVLPVTEIK
jgi:hypothetical protein